MLSQRSLSLEQALQKLRHYCGYQERCHQEVKEKLYSFGLRKPDVETAVATLIEEDRLNEERFAIQFAAGRFRLKHWGKVKIRYELKQKQVSDYCIGKALVSIGEEDYQHTLRRLAEKKWESLKEEKDLFARKYKVQNYLIQKGFEIEYVRGTVQKIN
jgi:regulatory protein